MKSPDDNLNYLIIKDPMRGFREALKENTFQYPLKEFGEAMKIVSSQEPFKAFRDAMDKVVVQNPLKEISGAMKGIALHDLIMGVHEANKATTFQDPFKHFREALIKNVLEFPSENLNPNFESLSLTNFSDFLTSSRWPEIDLKDLRVNINGDTIVIDEKLFPLDKINNHLENISNQVKTNKDDFEIAIKGIISEIKTEKDPLLQKLLIYIIYPFIISLTFSIINPITDPYVKKNLNERVMIKPLKEGSETIDESRPYSIVTCNFLNVREKPHSKSNKIGYISLGKIVKIIKTDGNWSFIEWKDKELRTETQGWVYSQYIKNL